MRGSLTIAFRGEGTPSSPVWCFASREWGESSSSEDGVSRTIYAGTGPDGSVLATTDLSSWSEFMSVDDCHARSMIVWAGALFVGTQPKGRIYVHNFASGQEYLFVETEDSAVTAFAEHDGKLYAGTAPAGIVYSFDGLVWKEEHRPYGGGVTAMVSSSGTLFVFSSSAEGPVVFSSSAEGPVVFDGTSWKTYPQQTSGTATTVASNRIAARGVHRPSGMSPIGVPSAVSSGLGRDAQDARPTSPQFNVAAAAGTTSGPAFGGADNGTVLVASGGGFSKLADVGSPVCSIVDAGDGALMIASGGKVFLARDSQ
jgi:hypothetical protein